MLKFKFNDFLLDNRISAADLARQIKVHYFSVWKMVERGSIKPSFLAKLETLYASASEYLTPNA